MKDERKLSILIVDDDSNSLALVRELLRFILRESGPQEVELLTATSGEEGYEIANRHEIDLLITDYYLPGVNGLGLIRSLRAGQTRMILMSSNHDLLNLLSSRGEIDAVLKKPVDRTEFKELIRKSISNGYRARGNSTPWLNAASQW